MSDLHYDLCVIGGGINGAGIARDAAGRGLSVILVEAQDLAGATSSSSSKLIHGGLRYLEHFEFKMVRKALKEREILLGSAPHIVKPAEFVFLQDGNTRPQWLVRAGLWLYDHIGGKSSLPNSKISELKDDKYGAPLLNDVSQAIIYSDCIVDDTRLVIANAIDAAAHGAKILTHTICDDLSICDGRWRVRLRDMRAGSDTLEISASMVVNASGPWVGKFLNDVGIGENDPDLPKMRLVKGSHIILPRLYDGEHIYVLQQSDKRIVFACPYQEEYTLIGTTEEGYEGDPRDAQISDDEMAYLCNAVNGAFKNKILPSDVLFTFSGVRPLLDDGGGENTSSSAVSREYMIYHHNRFDPPLLSIFGGKLTTYRALSEAVIDKLMSLSGRASIESNSREPLAGGDFGGKSFDEFLSAQKRQYPWLPSDLLYRYVSSYGTRMDWFLDGVQGASDLGMHYGDQVFGAEIDYLIKYEWASSAQDIIWRRSKLGLHISQDTIRNIEAAFQ